MGAPEFSQIFEQQVHFVWRTLARMGVPEREVPDLCQEVFLVVLRTLPEFEGRSSLKTWLFAICRRVAANYRRKASTRREAPTDRPPEPRAARSADPAEQLGLREDLALLAELLDALEPGQREVFVLYEIEEMTMREVAESVGCPLTTAFSRLYAARREIQARLRRLRARRRVA